MGKLARSKRSLHFKEKSPDTRIGKLFETFLKLLYLINYPFIHPCFTKLSFKVNLWVLKGYPPSIATECYEPTREFPSLPYKFIF
jgi:hypothetical protein